MATIVLFGAGVLEMAAQRIGCMLILYTSGLNMRSFMVRDLKGQIW